MVENRNQNKTRPDQTRPKNTKLDRVIRKAFKTKDLAKTEATCGQYIHTGE